MSLHKFLLFAATESVGAETVYIVFYGEPGNIRVLTEPGVHKKRNLLKVYNFTSRLKTWAIMNCYFKSARRIFSAPVLDVSGFWWSKIISIQNLLVLDTVPLSVICNTELWANTVWGNWLGFCGQDYYERVLSTRIKRWSVREEVPTNFEEKYYVIPQFRSVNWSCEVGIVRRFDQNNNFSGS